MHHEGIVAVKGWNKMKCEHFNSGWCLNPRSAYYDDLCPVSKTQAYCKYNTPENKAAWTSVKDALPEPGERVLLCENEFICEGYMMKSGEFARFGCIMDWMKPTHWMPLPELPKEGGVRQWLTE